MDGIESQFPFYDFGRQQNYQKKKQNKMIKTIL